MYDKLFERGKIGGLELKNRIFKPAAQSTPCYDGHVSERLIRFYEEEARGGAGLIIVGLTRVSKYETPEPSGAIGIERDDCIAGFGALAQAIHSNGAKCCLQLAHFGSHAYPPIRCVSREGLPYDFWLPEHHPGMKVYPHQEYTLEEIQELVGFYGDAAARGVKAGFDMIEVHAGHRHGLGLFVSPLTNRRTDMYGGSYENRTRVVFEALADIRRKIGDAVPISVRINGTDCDPDGVQIDEAVRFAKDLEHFGVNAINVSNQNAVVNMAAPLGVHAWAAEAVKQAVGIPVMSCGSFNTPEIAEETLESGKADYVGTGRALFADPYWPVKARTGRRDEIRPCIRCMECVGPKYSWVCPIACSVNATLGKETELPIVRATSPRRVAVVGGGVGGMEAALILALRGHRVTIFEKRRLGGRLNEASVPEFKADLRRLTRYYENRIRQLGIEVVYREATAEQLKNDGYEAVVVATGGQPVLLNVPGVDKPHVYSALDVLEKKPALDRHIIMVGGGSVGVETAIWLAAQGKQVTVVEMLDEILAKEYIFTKMVYGEMIRQNGITVMTGTRLKSVGADTVTVCGSDGAEQTLKAEQVVISAGLRPDTDLRDRLDKLGGLDVYAAGDCLAPRKIFDAVHEGNSCAREI